MDGTDDLKRNGKHEVAFQPFTVGGVARFGYSRRSFLLLIEILVALFCTGCIVWFFCGNYMPVIRSATEALPESTSTITDGRLCWQKGQPDGVLAQSPALAIIVQAYPDSPRLGTESDVTLSLCQNEARIFSYGRYAPIPYSKKELRLSGSYAIAWWQAWTGPFLFWVAFIPCCALLLTWQVLSFIYMPFIKGWTWIIRRQISWGEAYSVAGASLMLGAFLLGLAILGYSQGCYPLLVLGIAFVLHFVPAWFFIIVCPFFFPRLPKKVRLAKVSPFAERVPQEESLSL